MFMTAETLMVTPEEVGTIITELAAADNGFLLLLLTAAGKVECDLSLEDFAKLAECKNNPGELKDTPNCINARKAFEKRFLGGKFEKVKEPTFGFGK